MEPISPNETENHLKIRMWFWSTEMSHANKMYPATAMVSGTFVTRTNPGGEITSLWFMNYTFLTQEDDNSDDERADQQGVRGGRPVKKTTSVKENVI